MIIITGPGRSGTSLLARLYQELGFDPGGEWHDSIHGGLEPSDVVEMNETILEELGLSPMGAPGGVKKRIRRAGGALVPDRLRAGLRSRLQGLPWMGSNNPGMLQWPKFEPTVERLSPQLNEIAARHPVTKDPRFFWTLPVWAAAVPIEHVLVSIRHLDATVESRKRMDSVRFRTAAGIRNSVVYGLGLTALAAEEYRVPYSIVRFPDFIDRPDDLYRASCFPTPVDPATFRAAFDRLVRPELIHDRR